MKKTLIILTFIFIGCSKKQSEQNFSQKDKDLNNHIKTNLTTFREIENEAKTSQKDSNSLEKHIYLNFSNKYNFELNLIRNYKGNENIKDSWILNIYDKKNNFIDSICQNIISYGIDFKDFNSSRSYITGENKNKETVDNNYGDMIIADFNFDKLDDIALVNNLGGNGGRFYSYYLQQNNQKFKKDNFLTDSMVYFPSEFRRKDKVLTTYVHAGVCGLGEHKYKVIGRMKWKEIKHRIINICEEEIK